MSSKHFLKQRSKIKRLFQTFLSFFGFYHQLTQHTASLQVTKINVFPYKVALKYNEINTLHFFRITVSHLKVNHLKRCTILDNLVIVIVLGNIGMTISGAICAQILLSSFSSVLSLNCDLQNCVQCEHLVSIYGFQHVIFKTILMPPWLKFKT